MMIVLVLLLLMTKTTAISETTHQIALRLKKKKKKNLVPHSHFSHIYRHVLQFLPLYVCMSLFVVVVCLFCILFCFLDLLLFRFIVEGYLLFLTLLYQFIFRLSIWYLVISGSTCSPSGSHDKLDQVCPFNTVAWHHIWHIVSSGHFQPSWLSSTTFLQDRFTEHARYSILPKRVS